MKKYLLSFVFIILSVNIFAQEQLSKEILHNRELIKIFEKAYPQINFEINFDEETESRKCFLTTSSFEVIRVKLNFSLFSNKKS